MDADRQEIEICVARREDAGEILDIYAPYVSKTAITFDYEVPSLQEQEEKILHTLERYPFLVAKRGGRIMGYAYAGPFKNRAAYDWSVELSIYIHQEERRTGIGRLLYQTLEEILDKMGICNLYACITYIEQADEYLTPDSVRFHERMGYTMVGRFGGCGYKFGRWYDMCWMEKKIRQNSCPAGELLGFPEVQDRFPALAGKRQEVS